jgi:hypothetical protein
MLSLDIRLFLDQNAPGRNGDPESLRNPGTQENILRIPAFLLSLDTRLLLDQNHPVGDVFARRFHIMNPDFLVLG